ncbi:ABC transporter permease [Bradyrhizobium diazoefficiens]|jgi:ABC-2 type transport system permease protein|nr:ABC transporter permease [Bradyrhizobium diazoefficiens]MBR0967886.1 ABC transporter permease [Bradyrhizobium diazoefficiens]MBR0981283.1 ABC transporter permease [Bradyrhizobium diazoefficiens]MBR1010737.1 ABC transporter permease [Bradyrhizobium diazoefficiens]MBR1017248.1 ABC transporter permease [Bradyrhizobium diazoefficiens]MBR1054496.1 ABC transporter permease [Bradyrhizobium diazoefficiens]
MGSRIQLATEEILAQVTRPDRWGTLAVMDISLRYRRTVIGPLWITLTLGATIVSVGSVYATLFKQDIAGFLPLFAIGLVVWTLIATTLQEGSSIFVTSGHLIKAVPAPLIVHVLQMIARNVLILAHHLVIVVLLYIVLPWPLHWTMLLAVPGLAILLITLLGASVALGMLCARFRDIGSAIVSGLQFIFFLTPIIWNEDAVRGTAFHWLVRINPFATLIDLVRRPLLSQPTDPAQWLLGLVYAAVVAAIGIGCYARYRHRVAYWL